MTMASSPSTTIAQKARGFRTPPGLSCRPWGRPPERPGWLTLLDRPGRGRYRRTRRELFSVLSRSQSIGYDQGENGRTAEWYGANRRENALARDLETSSRLFAFVFRMFASGDAVLPSQGMGAMAQQLAERLPPGTVCTNSAVARLEEHGVRLADGRQLSGKAIVVATESPAAASLLGEPQPPAGRSVTCLYFAAERPPVDEPILVLNGEGMGVVNNLCVPSLVGSTYAPPGADLVSVTVLGIPALDCDHLESAVRQQLQEWFGNQVQTWRHLRTYHIPFALPDQSPPALSPVAKPPRRRDGIWLCGDYLDTASIQGAMVSGRRAAEEILSTQAVE